VYFYTVNGFQTTQKIRYSCNQSVSQIKKFDEYYGTDIAPIMTPEEKA